MEFVKIVGMCVLGACAYGIAHDQITARLCVEYFTIAHPPIISSKSPTVLALFWGVFATWWMGAIVGVCLGLCARLGRRRRMSARRLRRPLIATLLVVGVVALLAGIIGYEMSKGHVRLAGSLAERISPEKHGAFLAVAWAHSGAYLSAGIAAIALAGWIVGRRGIGDRVPASGAPDQRPVN